MTARDLASLVTDQPLAGKVIVLARSPERAGTFATRVRALGGEPIIAPAIAIAPPLSWTLADAALRRLAEYRWVAFTSANAVSAVVARLADLGIDRESLASVRLAAVGPETGAAIRRLVRSPDLISTAPLAAGLARELPEVRNQRVLFPGGDLARDVLVTALTERGAVVDRIVVYRTIPGEGIPSIARLLAGGTVDALVLTSPSAVEFITAAMSDLRNCWMDPARPAIFCLGPVTAKAATVAGLAPQAVPAVSTQAELLEEAVRWFAARARKG